MATDIDADDLEDTEEPEAPAKADKPAGADFEGDELEEKPQYQPYGNFQKPQARGGVQLKDRVKDKAVGKAKEVVGDKVGQAGRKVASQAAKTAVKAGARAVGSAVASATASAMATLAAWAAPWIGIAVLVIALVIIALVGVCRVPGAGWIPGGLGSFCKAIGSEEVNVGQGGSGTGEQVDTGTIPPGSYTHAQALVALQAVGISVSSSGNCSDRTRSNCTSLEGMRVATVNEIIAFKQGCDAWATQNRSSTCSVIVTGGTETGHAIGPCSHSSGHKFDMGLNDNVNSYIMTSGLFAEGSARGTHRMFTLRALSTAHYYLESNHWDVSVSCNSGTESEDPRPSTT